MEKRGQRRKGRLRQSYDLKQDIVMLQLEENGAEWNTVGLGYYIMKGNEYFVSL
jgi:hypothetical protein